MPWLREFFDEAFDIALRGLGINLEFGADVMRPRCQTAG